jgi:CBS-domain-containing membrane protein
MLAEDLTAALARTGEVARAELESVDAVLIRTQLQRFERRFQYWSERERG